jgi:hypothetical protein
MASLPGLDPQALRCVDAWASAVSDAVHTHVTQTAEHPVTVPEWTFLASELDGDNAGDDGPLPPVVRMLDASDAVIVGVAWPSSAVLPVLSAVRAACLRPAPADALLTGTLLLAVAEPAADTPWRIRRRALARTDDTGEWTAAHEIVFAVGVLAAAPKAAECFSHLRAVLAGVCVGERQRMEAYVRAAMRRAAEQRAANWAAWSHLAWHDESGDVEWAIEFLQTHVSDCAAMHFVRRCCLRWEEGGQLERARSVRARLVALLVGICARFPELAEAAQSALRQPDLRHELDM